GGEEQPLRREALHGLAQWPSAHPEGLRERGFAELLAGPQRPVRDRPAQGPRDQRRGRFLDDGLEARGRLHRGHRPPPPAVDAWIRGAGTTRPRAASSAAPVRTTRRSSNRAPTNWTPTGSPASVVPHGMLSAGCCVMLNGYVYGVHEVQSGLCQPGGTSAPASKAAIGVVGVTRMSSCWWESAMRAPSASRTGTACT